MKETMSNEDSSLDFGAEDGPRLILAQESPMKLEVRTPVWGLCGVHASLQDNLRVDEVAALLVEEIQHLE